MSTVKCGSTTAPDEDVAYMYIAVSEWGSGADEADKRDRTTQCYLSSEIIVTFKLIIKYIFIHSNIY